MSDVIDKTFKQVAADVKDLNANMATLPTLAALSAYKGMMRTIQVPGVGPFVQIDANALYPINGKTVIAVKDKPLKVWVRTDVNYINVFEFINLSDADHTTGIQAAVDFCTKANNPQQNKTNTPHLYRSSQLVFPFHRYNVSREIVIAGAIDMRLLAGTSYSGARIVQTGTNKHLFRMGKDNDGQSNCLYISGGALKMGSDSPNPTGALVYAGDGSDPKDGTNNSLYMENVWLCTPEAYALDIRRGDDLRVAFCTFDVMPFRAIRLGTPTKSVTNWQIVHNTFFNVGVGVLDLYGANGGLFESNRVYKDNEYQRCPYGINIASSNVYDNDFSRNRFTSVDKVLLTQWGNGNSFCDNRAKDCAGMAVELGGGNVIRDFTCDGNRFEGDFNKTITTGGQTLPQAPIYANATTVTDSTFRDNTLINKNGTAATPMLFNHIDTSVNVFRGNVSRGFADAGQVKNPLLNGLPQKVAIPEVGPIEMTAGQRVAARRPVVNVLPGDVITLTDQTGTWHVPAGVTCTADVGEPGYVRIVFENLNAVGANVPAIGFFASAYRRQF